VGLDPGGARLAALDEQAGRSYRSDARIVAGSAVELADLMEDWLGHGIDGYRLRPLTLPHDLAGVAGELVPELRRRGLVPADAAPSSLRARLGLAHPDNRYAPDHVGGIR
jgi:alkanesulfonate monooxygenase SsuD/methylene tetrahydromethanopterin reductase-like flavin-dependent oxidoreductase (luciferase family)